MDSIQKIINNIILNFSALSEALQEQEVRTTSRLDYHEEAMSHHQNEINKHKQILKSIAETINNSLD